jgi:predicted pyridoxine 5'-phosphate oxidase superfamily flavin-nucleotide-binding protein
MASIGRKVIHDYLTDGQREFFAGLPSIFIAGRDHKQQIWGSVLVGSPGFIASPSPRVLRIQAWPKPADPLAAAWLDGAAIGGLGIELHRRRRNRVNGSIAIDSSGNSFFLEVRQGFPNCPQYINVRRPDYGLLQPIREIADQVRHFTRLDEQASSLVRRADTFFIASSDGGEAVDMSHRGGPPGLITIRDEQTLIWPDYLGNFFFNTLGNLAVDARCGLLIVDFANGDSLQLTGRAEVLWHWDMDSPAFAGAQRLLQFNLEAGVIRSSAVRDASPAG